MRHTRNVSIPKDLAKRMDDIPGVNWSEIAQKAFTAFLDGRRTTQVRCAVYQREAIRRGHNCDSTVKLSIDVSKLSDHQRDMLAECFDDGWIVDPIDGSRIQIDEPTECEMFRAIEMAVARTRKDSKAIR